VSPSWTSRFSVAPSVLAGISIGRNQVCSAVLGAKGGKHQVLAIRTQDLPIPLFAALPTKETEALLTGALHAVSEGFRDLFASVRVALPDTVIRSTVFELDQLPKSADMRKSLLCWRFAKEWQRPEGSLDCCGFDLGEDHGKHLLFGQAGDLQWLDCVRRALARSGIVPWSLNAASVYRFNFFHDAIVGGGGALLSLDPDCWNLLIFDETGRVRQVLTRLRKSPAAEDEAASIADEAERAILAYVQQDGRRRVGKVYLAGNGAEMTALAKVFDGRLSEPAILLYMNEGFSGTLAGVKEGLAPLALAAAMNT